VPVNEIDEAVMTNMTFLVGRAWLFGLASCGYCNKSLVTWWLKTTQIYSLTVLEVSQV
jgi:hypothetical protein